MEFLALYSTHNTFAEGYGGKTHLSNRDEIKPFCGYKSWFGATVVDGDYQNQPDPDKNLCQKCKKAANKIIDNLKPNTNGR